MVSDGLLCVGGLVTAAGVYWLCPPLGVIVLGLGIIYAGVAMHQQGGRRGRTG